MLSDARQPVVVMTVYRRYFELERAVRNIRDLAGEFGEERPPVVVVWASPEVGRLWFLRRLQQEGLVDHVVGRPELPTDGTGSTTAPESVNLRLGLEFAARTYGADRYAVVQACDCLPGAGKAYRLFAEKMADPATMACVFTWQNAIAREGVYHTNCFAVTLADERYWPPVSDPEHQDVLERQWGRQLSERRLAGVARETQANDYWFVHAHLSEGQPEWPSLPESGDGRAPLVVSGWRPWWERFWRWLSSPFRRPR